MTNKTALFSISTKNFWPQASVALNSFVEHCDYSDSIDIHNITLDDIQNEKYTSSAIRNIMFRHKNNEDSLRWSLKSVIILYFLQDKKYDNVIYIDNDIYFINNNNFLIDDINGILLTKHNRPLYPNSNLLEQKNGKIKYKESIIDSIYYEQFLCNFTDGFFNAGFIGVNQSGIPAINWWATMNLWQCAKSHNHGLFVDQKYLDILALEFNDIVKICTHPGCNLAVWNSQTVHRSYIDNKWKINDIYDPIFCHFSSLNYGVDDAMLQQYYQEYMNKLETFKKYST